MDRITHSESRRMLSSGVLQMTAFLASVCVLASGHARLEACEVCQCKRSIPVVDCSRRGLTELPIGIPNDTKALLLGENFLQEIPSDELLKLKSLVSLNVTKNNLTKPFEMPESVMLLYASNNRLQDIEPMMRNGVNLRTVTIDRNIIKKIDTGTFRRCTQLHYLRLRDSGISEIKPGGLAGLSNVRTFYVDGNNLTDLGPSSLEGLNSLGISATRNRLKRLQPHTFGTVGHLGKISLGKNELESFPAGLFKDPINDRPAIDLIELSLDFNRIRHVASDAFCGVRLLTILSMSHNDLTSLPEDMFGNMTIIGTLDISSNQLTGIPDGLFRGQTMIKDLYLQRNQIRALNSKMFKGLHGLKELMIFDNPITEVADWVFHETQLINLYMFQTNLTSVRSRPFATINNTMMKISLYGNRLENISNAVWQDLGTNCYVAIDNTLKFAPAIKRDDLSIELVSDGFAQPIDVPHDVAEVLQKSGFSCLPQGRLKNVWKCTPCRQGFFGASWIADCLACPPGGFYQIKTGQVADKAEGINCQKCNNGTYVTPAAHPGIEPADCVVCPTGTEKRLHAGFRACKCLENYYRNNRFGECLQCPTEGLNCSGEYQHLLPGFWWTWDWGSPGNFQSYQQFVYNLGIENVSYSDTPQNFSGVLPKVHSCPRRESCANAADGINATCEDGYEGWLCSQCSAKFYSWFDLCFECPKWWWFLLEVIAVVVVVIVVIGIIVWDLKRNRRTGRSVGNILLARGKILLGFYQVMGEIFSALNEVPWPQTLVTLGSFFKLLEVNVMQMIISPRCYFPDFTYPNIYIEFLAGLSFVVAVVLLAWCIYNLNKCYLVMTSTLHGERTVGLSKTKQTCCFFVVMLLFVSYPSLSSVIITLLPSGCDMFYLDENETFIVSRLRSDYSIDCEKPRHVHYSHAAEAALCYVVGFPCVLFAVLWWSKYGGLRRAARDIGLHDVSGDLQSGFDGQPGITADNGVATGQTEDGPLSTTAEPETETLSWQSFLCENYKPRFWYWEIVELARKILQTLFVLLFGPEDPFTLFATIVISGGFLLVHATARPMKYDTEHRLQMCSLGTIFLNLLVASLLLLPTDKGHASGTRKEILAVLLVLLNLSIIVFVAGSSIWSGIRVLRSQACFGRMVECVLGMCKLCGRQCRQCRTGRDNSSHHGEVGEDSPLIVSPPCVDRPYSEIIAEHDAEARVV